MLSDHRQSTSSSQISSPIIATAKLTKGWSVDTGATNSTQISTLNSSVTSSQGDGNRTGAASQPLPPEEICPNDKAEEDNRIITETVGDAGSVGSANRAGNDKCQIIGKKPKRTMDELGSGVEDAAKGKERVDGCCFRFSKTL